MTPSSPQSSIHTDTRGRIMALLLDNHRTVGQLATSLGVTKNAVRAQISLMLREGFLEIKGEVKGSRRPAAVYGIRPGAEVGSAKAYPVVLSQLVKVLADTMPNKQFESVMRDTGRALAASVQKPAGTSRERIDRAVKVLHSLGSMATVSEEGGRIVVKGNGCPISRVVAADNRFCAVMESFMGSLTGLPVRERCDHGEQPQCRFEIKVPPERR